MVNSAEKREETALKRWLALLSLFLAFVAMALCYDAAFPKTDKNRQLDGFLGAGNAVVPLRTQAVAETQSERLIFQIFQVSCASEAWGVAVYEKGINGGCRPIWADCYTGDTARSYSYSQGPGKDWQIAAAWGQPETTAALVIQDGREERAFPATSGQPLLLVWQENGYPVHSLELLDDCGRQIPCVTDRQENVWRLSNFASHWPQVWYVMGIFFLTGCGFAYYFWNKKET